MQDQKHQAQPEAPRSQAAAKAKAAVAKAKADIEAAKPKPTKPVIVVGAGPARMHPGIIQKHFVPGQSSFCSA